jgi:endonuclease/exonuclease/phosphatase (EEP) superfamily protein YafD
VLLGDFNMGPRHPGYARFERLGLVDAFAMAGTGRGLTFPIRMRLRQVRERPGRVTVVPTPPVKRFDYVWVTPDLDPEAAWIGPDTGSDHASVMARIRLLPSP